MSATSQPATPAATIAKTLTRISQALNPHSAATLFAKVADARGRATQVLQHRRFLTQFAAREACIAPKMGSGDASSSAFDRSRTLEIGGLWLSRWVARPCLQACEAAPCRDRLEWEVRGG